MTSVITGGSLGYNADLMTELTRAAAPSAERTLLQSKLKWLSEASTEDLIENSIEQGFAAGVRVFQSIFLS